MKNFKLLFLFFIPLSLFSEPIDKEILKDFFLNEYTISTSFCEPKCRDLKYNDKFIAKIVDFDASTGITSCEVFPKASGDNELLKLSIDANSQNLTCLNQYNDIEINYTANDLKSKNFSVDADTKKLTSEYDKSKLTMSRFIGGLATLDNEVVDIIQTVDIGQLKPKNPEYIYSLGTDGNEKPDVLLNSIDKLSSENLGYYVDLFYSMDKVYEYMVAYVFVFISLFFMLLYSSKIALKKIAKKTTAFDEPWQSKIAVIVFTTVIFFIPMKLDENYSSTLFQNIWKYFVEESSSIADKANTIGMQSYMKKVYNTTGLSGVKTEANLRLLKAQQEHLLVEYEYALEQCKDRFTGQITFQKIDKNQIKDIEDRKGIYDDKLTFRACRSIEKRYKIAKTGFEQSSHSLSRIETAYGISGSDLQENLKKMNEHLNKRVHELGWYSSVLAPTLQVLTKISLLQGSTIEKSTSDKFRAYINTASEESISIKDNIEKNKEGINMILDSKVTASVNNDTKKKLGEALSKVSFISLVPGGKTIEEFVTNFSSNDIKALYNAVKVTKDGNTANKLPPNVKSMSFSTTLIKLILEALPFITTFIAVGVIIIMYIYELIVFSFISPFIVAYAVTTGHTQKILDFLVTALTLFLKPTIIVIAIYLSLFLYSIFQDIFVLMADEQFYLSLASTTDFLPSLLFYFIKEMLFIFAVFASVYFMWKLIVEMPDFIFKKIGLNNLGSGTQMASSMQQGFGKFGFRA